MDGIIALALAKKQIDKVEQNLTEGIDNAVAEAIERLTTDIGDATVTLSERNFVYDGTPKTPNVSSVVLFGKTLTKDVDYSVGVSPATDAGNYTLIISGIGSYNGMIVYNWSIFKAPISISGEEFINFDGIGQEKTITYTTSGDGEIRFAIRDPSVATISNVGGEVTITSVSTGITTLMAIVDDTRNYMGASKTINVEVRETPRQTVFGVVWDYSLSSPVLARLTPQNDPLGVVTTVPTQEPTACVGNVGGQSDFDNYMPWEGMQRYNYVNGQIVDFVDYNNGETFVYIPEFWCKIVNDSENSKKYFYVSDSELDGFTKHSGSGRYVGRYPCDSNFKSVTGVAPRTSTNLSDFRTGITSIDNSHYQFDIHVYSALIILIIIEWANYDTSQTIGSGIDPSNSPSDSGGTDSLTYHTGKSIINEKSYIQYRWIENLYGNLNKWVDGIVFAGNPKSVYIGKNVSNYANTANTDYYNTDIYLLTQSGFAKFFATSQNLLCAISDCSASSSTFLCSQYVGGVNGMALYSLGKANGLFTFGCDDGALRAIMSLGSRSILVLNDGGINNETNINY